MEFKIVSILLLLVSCQVIQSFRITDDVEEVNIDEFFEDEYNGDFDLVQEVDEDGNRIDLTTFPAVNFTSAVLYGGKRVEPGMVDIIPGMMYYFTNPSYPYEVVSTDRIIWELFVCDYCLYSYTVTCYVKLMKSKKCKHNHLDYFYTKNKSKGKRFCRERRFKKSFKRDSRFTFKADDSDSNRPGFECVIYTESSDINTADCDECGPTAAGYYPSSPALAVEHCMPSCYNGGTCSVDSDELISCACQSGTSGDYCEVNDDDCDPNPCHYADEGAVCIDLVDDYECECPFPMDPATDCEDNMQTLDGGTLYYSNETASWDSAKSNCSAMGGELAYADNIEELIVLANQVRDIYDLTDEIWVGAYMDSNDDPIWDHDDSAVTLSSSIDDVTDNGVYGDCIDIFTDGMVYNDDCTDHFHYMCLMP